MQVARKLAVDKSLYERFDDLWTLADEVGVTATVSKPIRPFSDTDDVYKSAELLFECAADLANDGSIDEAPGLYRLANAMSTMCFTTASSLRMASPSLAWKDMLAPPCSASRVQNGFKGFMASKSSASMSSHNAGFDDTFISVLPSGWMQPLFADANRLFTLARQTVEGEGDDEGFPGLYLMSRAMQKIVEGAGCELAQKFPQDSGMIETIVDLSPSLCNAVVYAPRRLNTLKNTVLPPKDVAKPPEIASLFGSGQGSLNAESVACWSPLHYARAMGGSKTCHWLRALGAVDSVRALPLLKEPSQMKRNGRQNDTKRKRPSKGAQKPVSQKGLSDPIAVRRTKNHTSLQEELPPRPQPDLAGLFHGSNIVRQEHYYKRIAQLFSVGSPLTTRQMETSEDLFNEYFYGPRLYFSTQNGLLQLVDSTSHLLCSVDIPDRGKGGLTPLMHACWFRCHSSVLSLLSHGASVWTMTIVDSAAVGRTLRGFGFKLGAEARGKQGKGVSPLLLACMRGVAATVAVLLSEGADINVQDELGNTPLHLAAAGGHMAMLTTLLRFQGDLWRCNPFGECAVDLALAMKYTSVIHLFRCWGTLGVRECEIAEQNNSSSKVTYPTVNMPLYTKLCLIDDQHFVVQNCTPPPDTAPSSSLTQAIYYSDLSSVVCLMYARLCQAWQVPVCNNVRAQLVVHYWPDTFRKLRINGVDLGLKGMMAILDLLTLCHNVDELDARGSHIDDEIAFHLSVCCRKHPTIRRVFLGNNPNIGRPSVQHFAKMLTINHNLVELDVSGTNISLPQQQSLDGQVAFNLRQQARSLEVPPFVAHKRSNKAKSNLAVAPFSLMSLPQTVKVSNKIPSRRTAHTIKSTSPAAPSTLSMSSMSPAPWSSSPSTLRPRTAPLKKM